MTEKRNKKYLTLIVCFILFYAVWTLFTLYGKPFIADTFRDDVAAVIAEDAIIKNLVWTIPAFFLVRHFSSQVYIGLKEMFTAKVNWLKYLPVFLLFTAYALGTEYLSAGKIEINKSFGAASIVMVLFVGLTEEMLFRGWLLNATVSKERQWLPILINSVLFMTIHFPIWILEGKFMEVMSSFSFVFIILLGIIFGAAFLKSRSIIVPILLHMYWDLLAEMFF